MISRWAHRSRYAFHASFMMNRLLTCCMNHKTLFCSQFPHCRRRAQSTTTVVSCASRSTWYALCILLHRKHCDGSRPTSFRSFDAHVVSEHLCSEGALARHPGLAAPPQAFDMARIQQQPDHYPVWCGTRGCRPVVLEFLCVSCTTISAAAFRFG